MIGISLFLINTSLQGEEFSARRQFCKSKLNFKTLNSSLLNKENLLSFENEGGLFNGGVCWWHSRFQRNALYLAYFRPDLPAPTKTSEIKKIIRKIIQGRVVTKIPGFQNLQQFSTKYSKLIQRKLNQWQLRDGFVFQKWIAGLSGKSKASSDYVLHLIDRLYQNVEIEKNIAYTMLQMSGIVAHAWLVFKVSKTLEGYNLYFIDSNYPDTPFIYQYKNGDKFFDFKWYGNFIPYLKETKEPVRMKNALAQYCQTN